MPARRRCGSVAIGPIHVCRFTEWHANAIVLAVGVARRERRRPARRRVRPRPPSAGTHGARSPCAPSPVSRSIVTPGGHRRAERRRQQHVEAVVVGLETERLEERERRGVRQVDAGPDVARRRVAGVELEHSLGPALVEHLGRRARARRRGAARSGATATSSSQAIFRRCSGYSRTTNAAAPCSTPSGWVTTGRRARNSTPRGRRP